MRMVATAEQWLVVCSNTRDFALPVVFLLLRPPVCLAAFSLAAIIQLICGFLIAMTLVYIILCCLPLRQHNMTNTHIW